MLKVEFDNKKAMALIVTLGILTLLLIMGFVFASMTRVEKQVSVSYMDSVRARLCAISGLEYAAVRLREDIARRPYSDINPANSPWIYDPQSPQTPLENTVNPSYKSLEFDMWIEALQTPQRRGISGYVSGSYGGRREGDNFALKIKETSSMVNINAVALGGDATEVAFGARFLDNLGMGISIYGGGMNPVAAARFAGFSGGRAIIEFRNSRPGGRIMDKNELIEIIPNQQTLDILKEYITEYSWIDYSVIRPEPQSYNETITRRASGSRVAGQRLTWRCADRNTTAPSAPRAPVNINTASEAVLYACVRGLSGTSVRFIPWWEGWGRFQTIAQTPISDSQARSVVNAIVVRRDTGRGGVGPFRTWEEFEYWVDGRQRDYDAGMPSSAGLTFLPQPQRDLIKANANPNTRFNKFNPNRNMLLSYVPRIWYYNFYGKPIDKSDLSYWTTEFCFGPTGYFEIESLGRVLSPQSRIVAQKKLRTVLKVFDVMRHTTQFDFENNVYGGTGGGMVGIVTYPNNMRDLMNRSIASRFDGQVSLKEVRPPTNWWYAEMDSTVLSTALSGRSNWRWTWQTFGYHNPRRADVREYSTPAGFTDNPRLVSSLPMTLHDGRPTMPGNASTSDLFSDGHYISTYRLKTLMYSSYGPIHPRYGTVRYFMKPDLLGGGYYGSILNFMIKGSDIRQFSQAPIRGNYIANNGMVPSKGFGVKYDCCGRPVPPPERVRPNADWYGLFITPWWFNGGHVSNMRYGELPAALRRSDLVYPFRGDYYIYNWPGVRMNLMIPGEWNYVQVTWANYAGVVYINGDRAGSWSWYLLSPPTYASYYGAPCAEYMQVGYISIYSGWNWSFPTWETLTQATIDNIAGHWAFSGNAGFPDRYPPTNGTSYYAGQFNFGTNSPVRVLNISYTQYRPLYYANDVMIGLTVRPRIYLDWNLRDRWPSTNNDGGGRYGRDTDDATNGEDDLGQGSIIDALTTSGSFVYYARFYDNGLTPRRHCPFLDDVTIFYTTGPQYMIYSEVF